MKTIRPTPEFHPFDTLDGKTVEELRTASLRFSDADWLAHIQDDLATYCPDLSPRLSGELWRVALAGVEEAVVCTVADFDDPGLTIYGQARMLRIGDGRLPYVILNSERREQTLAHELIHVQQYVHPHSPGISCENRELMFDMDMIRAAELRMREGKEAVIRFVSDACCYKAWTELEAHHFTPGRNLSADQLVDDVVNTVQPYSAFEAISAGFDLGLDALSDMEERFSAYCNAMESQIPWVRELTEPESWASLGSEILLRDETLMMEDFMP